MDIIDLVDEHNINHDLAEKLLFDFIESKNLENELSIFIKKEIQLLKKEEDLFSLNKSDFKSFPYAVKITGEYNVTYEFQSMEDVNVYLNIKFPKFKEKYNNIEYKVIELDVFKLHDFCNVSGEGSDVFRIIGIKKYSKNSYGYALGNGFVEPIHKCHRQFLKEITKQSKYPYIAECSNYGAWAVFYGVDDGIILSAGSSWMDVGTKVKENGFRFVDQNK